jgi:hypothetical protein
MPAHRHRHALGGNGASMTSWPVALAERLAQLESIGADRTLAAQARLQIKAGELTDAEETLGHIELYLAAWMRLR